MLNTHDQWKRVNGYLEFNVGCLKTEGRRPKSGFSYVLYVPGNYKWSILNGHFSKPVGKGEESIKIHIASPSHLHS